MSVPHKSNQMSKSKSKSVDNGVHPLINNILQSFIVVAGTKTDRDDR